MADERSTQANNLADKVLQWTGNEIQTIDGSTVTGKQFGITTVDMYRLSSSFTGDAIPVASNLERVDTDGFAQIGTGVSESSGIFTFPQTGIYLIRFLHGTSLTGDNAISQPNIQTTTDGTNYDIAASSYSSINQVSTQNTYQHSICEVIFDVANVSTHKVKFHVAVDNNSTVTEGNTNENVTAMLFIKLGDT